MVPSLLIVLVSLLGAGDERRLSWHSMVSDAGVPAAHIPGPARGRLLVADRSMPDPRFRRSVILLLDHTDTGSLGVIINRPTEIGLAELIDDLDPAVGGDRPVFLGGPVAMDRVLFLVRDATAPEEGNHVFGDIYAGGKRTELTRLLGSKSHEELRVFIGYAGWGPGQLDGEILKGGWYLFDVEADTIFSSAPQDLWDDFERRHRQRIVVTAPAGGADRVDPARRQARSIGP